MALIGILKTPKISAEVLPLSEVDTDEDLPRTPRGCPGPIREFPDDLNAQKCNKNLWVFNDFEMALNALGGLPNVAKGSPHGPPVLPRDGLMPPREPQRAPSTNLRSPK